MPTESPPAAEKTKTKTLAQRHATAAESAAHGRTRNLIIIISIFVAAAVLLGVFTWYLSCASVRAELSDGVQKVTTRATAYGTDHISVAAGLPVEWTLECDENIGTIDSIIQEYLGIDERLIAGGTVTVTFTPEDKGTFYVLSWDGTACCTANFCTIFVT
ncbi:MAG: cupredoxin domain-containing protein [Firmicutes bacterium]|nr:cupredoxin domain-containing protein [Bacillota bacterium]